MEQPLSPGLYLVATPLGNLADLSDRAREVLSRASFIAGESSKVVLRWLEILAPWPNHKPGVLTYRESSRNADQKKILSRLEMGCSVALISDAGTPCLSDPGWQLVNSVREAGHSVRAVPGPCAAVSALALSGFPSRQFHFQGFLPASGRNRREALEAVTQMTCPVILYEGPHRFLQLLSDLAEREPGRPLFVAREMTKLFEESWRGTLAEATCDWPQKTLKGEFTLVVGPKKQETEKVTDVPRETLELVRGLKLPTKQASVLLKHFYPLANKKDLYRLLSAEKGDTRQ
jgi:16S rRNA (cytidine1402-2'-O)-methyltransferase